MRFTCFEGDGGFARLANDPRLFSRNILSLNVKKLCCILFLLYSYLDLVYLYYLCCGFFSFRQNSFLASWLGLFVSVPSTFDVHTVRSSVTRHAHWFDGNRQCSLCVEVGTSQRAPAGSSLCATSFCPRTFCSYFGSADLYQLG